MALDSIAFEMTDEQAKEEPKPGERKTRQKRTPGRRSNASVEKELRDQLHMAMQFAAAMWSMRDPFCAPVLSQQSEAIATEAAKLAAKSKWARRWLTEVVEVGSIIPLVSASFPVLKAVHEHHIAPAFHAQQSEENTTNGRPGTMG